MERIDQLRGPRPPVRALPRGVRGHIFGLSAHVVGAEMLLQHIHDAAGGLRLHMLDELRAEPVHVHA